MKVKIKRKDMQISALIFITGLLLPIFLTHERLDIYGSINNALEFWDKEHVIIAMFKLVFLNTLRAFPGYILMFLLFESLDIEHDGRQRKLEKVIVVLTVIPIMYKLIGLFYEIDLPVGKTSVLGILWFCFYTNLELKIMTVVEKSFVFLLFIAGIQWLDISTYFNFLKVGEITYDLNQVIDFMEARVVVTILCVSFFLFFILLSILLLYFFKGQEERVARYKENIENRYLKEAQQLVHDLKTPIFSVSTLIEVLKLQEIDEKKIKYYDRIENSLDKTNTMIGEILNVKSQKPIIVEEMMNFVFSFLSAHESSDLIQYENYLKKGRSISGNRVALSKVIINLIVNAFEAKASKVGVIIKDYNNYVLIKIKDNGTGIPSNIYKKIFLEGVSTKGSTGKGLAFVKKVMDEMAGKIYIKEDTKVGAEIYLVLRGK